MRSKLHQLFPAHVAMVHCIQASDTAVTATRAHKQRERASEIDRETERERQRESEPAGEKLVCRHWHTKVLNINVIARVRTESTEIFGQVLTLALNLLTINISLQCALLRVF